jgi:putative hemolysin
MGVAGLAAALVLLVAARALFAAIEVAMVVADDPRAPAETAAPGGRPPVLPALLAGRERVVALALTTSNLLAVSAAALLTAFLSRRGWRATVLGWVLFAPVSLLLSELLPKLLVLQEPLRFARRAARLLALLVRLCRPLLAAETAFARLLMRAFGLAAQGSGPFITREDLALLVRARGESQESGADPIRPAEREMISRILRFGDAEVRKVMVPLIRVRAASASASVAETIAIVGESGFSRIPIFEQTVLNIAGIVHVFDLLAAPDLARPVSELMRPVSYFPEVTPVRQIFLELQNRRENFAIVVDEYGAAAGIVTVEDLVEEVVGELEEERGDEVEMIKLVSPRMARVAAQVPVAELNERLHLKLPEGDDYATVAGLVTENLGRIPKPGEQLKLGEIIIRITRSDARAVREVTLVLPGPARAATERAG